MKITRLDRNDTELSRLVAGVAGGEEILFIRDGRAVARLVPVDPATAPIQRAGLAEGSDGSFEPRSRTAATEEPPAKVVTVHTAKTQLSRLINEALAGENIVIARGKVPAVRLTPIKPPLQRFLGALEGKIWYADDAFAPMTDEELKEWGY